MIGNRTSALCGIAAHMQIGVLISTMLSGCGGGAGGSGTEPPNTPSLTITVSDVFGEPAERAHVEVFANPLKKSLKATTDSNGKVRFAHLPVGAATVHASPSGTIVPGVRFGVTSESIDVADGAAMDVSVTLRPTGDPFAAVHASWVAATGASADGRSVDLAFDLYSFENVLGLFLAGCAPDDSDNTPVFRPNCVEDSDGFDAQYDAPGYDELLGTPIPGGTAVPFSVAVLLDQGRAIALNDSTDVRLFAVKYFLSMLRAEDRVLLAAFASDDPTGPRALLPAEPVTTLPEDTDIAFSASDKTVLFPVVDSLASLEGGASPLYAAIDRMLDVTAQNTAPGQRRAVVVLTTGTDETCGSAEQCLTARQALITKARATNVSIVPVGLGSDAGPIDVLALSELAEGTSGALLWANDAGQLPTLFGGLFQILDGTAETFEAHYRIQSPTDGTFQSGRTVHGTATIEFSLCPFDCWTVDVPFAARIP